MSLKTHYLPGDTQADRIRRYFIGTTFADFPSSGLKLGDLAFGEETGLLYAAIDATTWECPYLHAMAEVAMTGNAVATPIITQSTFTKVSGTTTLDADASLFDMPANNRLRYIGVPDAHLHLGCTLSVISASLNDTIQAVLYKNGTVNGNNEYTGGTQLSRGVIETRLFGIGDVTSTAIHVMTTMVTNDYVELALSNLTSAADLTVKHMNFFAVGFCAL